MVLGFMIAFFAIIVGVNVFMAHAAISTFGGVETASSYHAGQMFERDVAMAKAAGCSALAGRRQANPRGRWNDTDRHYRA